ncbi:thiopurine S-methyltransferase [Pseudoalteromonas sp. J010]|uniref:thiopurine S-methyltransferase n=1 Tax=Pseudoalteromonas sp. J010 TaxID=998465 RepID=UPI000F64FDE0|nr:thiopurine S-methyltransferase [Pseudoalteromonas sp. J010]RRS09213.1 thiopurine S-methyltransferase [Pseudoalteromonas sp. J010]
MEATYWQDLWVSGQTGFHEGQVNRMLNKYYHLLDLKVGERVLIPLCGKSMDITHFLSHGQHVVGVELYEGAVVALFESLKVSPRIHQQGAFRVYQAPNLTIFVGDFFAVSAQLLGRIDAVYDRAALVALPEPMRTDYTKHLVSLTKAAKQLLICFEYEQGLMSGPPFAVSPEMVERYYGAHYHIELQERTVLEGGLKEVSLAFESVWLLSS